MSSLTVVITGASRGIGKSLAKHFAQRGDQLLLTARNKETLTQTIAELKKEFSTTVIHGQVADLSIPDEARAFGRWCLSFAEPDILINNASAINLTKTEATPAKRFDLMFDVNVRGTFLASQAAIPHLRKGVNPHILNLSPPLSMKEKWFKNHVAYTMSKYGMSMCVLGMSGEFKRDGVAVNALWPATAIQTAALQMIPGIDTNFCRKPEIMADAAYVILNRDSKSTTGNFFVDEEVLRAEGVTDFDQYSVVPGTKDLLKDFFLD